MNDVKRRSFAAGYLLGLAGLPVAAAPVQFDSEPTMCLYGGTPLPYLRWDRKMYPKALVTYNFRTGEFMLAIYKQADYYQVEAPTLGGTYTQYWFGSEEENTALVFSCKAGDTGWNRLEKTSYGVNLSRISVLRYHTYEKVIWANFDLLWDDGTPYASGSAPEPITNPSAFDNKSYYNDVVLPSFSDEPYDQNHKWCIMKHETEDAYILHDTFLSGLFEKNDMVYHGSGPHLTYAAICQAGGDHWEAVDPMSYTQEVYFENDNYPKYLIGKYENLVWTEEEVQYNSSLPPSEPVPVVIPESKPGAVNDNKLMMLGCRLGYIIRTHRGKGNAEPDIPVGALISSDGYILRDCNGVYLTAKEDA